MSQRNIYSNGQAELTKRLVEREYPVRTSNERARRTGSNGSMQFSGLVDAILAGIRQFLGWLLRILSGTLADESPDDEVDDREDDEQGADHGFLVSGSVTDSDGARSSGVAVRAFDRDLRSETELGRATTDEDGHYEIGYSTEAFASAEYGGPDLVVRVYDGRGDSSGTAASETVRVIGTAETRFDASPSETVDVTVESPAPSTESECARLTAELRPLLDGVAPAELTDDDVTFLVGETGLDRRIEEFPAGAESVRLYAAAAKLSRRTDVDTEVFYALGRTGVALSVESLLAAEVETIRTSVSDAVESNIASPAATDALDKLEQRLRRLRSSDGSAPDSGGTPKTPETPPTPETAQATIRVVEAGSGDPLPSFEVRVTTVGAGESARTDTTDASGRVTVRFAKPLDEANTPGELNELERSDRLNRLRGPSVSDDSNGHRVRVAVLDGSGEPFHAEVVTLSDGDDRTLSVEKPAPGFDPGLVLSDLQTDAALGLSDGIIDVLGEYTLADVRTAGGVANLDVDASDLPDVGRVDAIADLTLTTDPVTATKLYAKGYANPLDVVAESRSAFLQSMSGTEGVTAADAEQVYAKARTQRAFLEEVVLAERKSWVNRRRSSPAGVSRGGGR